MKFILTEVLPVLVLLSQANDNNRSSSCYSYIPLPRSYTRRAMTSLKLEEGYISAHNCKQRSLLVLSWIFNRTVWQNFQKGRKLIISEYKFVNTQLSCFRLFNLWDCVLGFLSKYILCVWQNDQKLNNYCKVPQVTNIV